MGKKPPHSQQKPGRSKPSSSSSAKPPAKPRAARPVPPGEAATGGSPAAVADAQETKHCQALLDAFSSAFGPVLQRDDFSSVLQEVKGALFNRDFEGAFNSNNNDVSSSNAGGGAEEGDAEGSGNRDTEEEKEETSTTPNNAFLSVYAARWSPTRALCYGRILRLAIAPYLLSPAFPPSRPLRALCIGGGAAELAAFASHLALSPSSHAHLTLLDSGPWEPVIRALGAALTSPPTLSRYANAAARAANRALVAPPGRLSWVFERGDVLGLGEEALRGLLLRGAPGEAEGGGQGEEEEEEEGEGQALLVTLLFTLNELYASAGGVGRTTAFLRRLGAVIPAGSLLLVVDSPGSYSEAAVGKGGGSSDAGADSNSSASGGNKKRYPMQWLLDHTLLRVPEDEDRKRRRGQQAPLDDEAEGQTTTTIIETETRNTGGGCLWEKLESHDSVWFRLAEGLRYPIALENMRYQMHLYRACAREV
ncbi:hypothetical protein F4810DRAFT_417459 [Camillea tinctor]|nr:hypothetical protein F4810DRAFT_417459 [Camillea tinctor]